MNIMKTWLVTGSSKGLGRAIVERALNEGDMVLATARNPQDLDDLASAFPDRLEVFSLDVTNPEDATAAVIAPFEQTEASSFRDQIETNLFGVVNMIRAALPSMRARRSGHIINISSVGGRVGTAGLSAYQASKWAVGGLTEVISREIAPFGVEMISVEPGGMRTHWGATAQSGAVELLPDYEPTVGAFLNAMTGFVGNEVGDPAKIAKVVFDLTRSGGLPAHLILGSDALQVFADSEKARQEAAEHWMDVSRSTDFDDGDISYLAALQKP
jgi:NAD(P)-dependent dehydrogenase (short-subunit alcohol dehydrogenase family)